jgi:hypothetical protein
MQVVGPPKTSCPTTLAMAKCTTLASRIPHNWPVQRPVYVYRLHDRKPVVPLRSEHKTIKESRFRGRAASTAINLGLIEKVSKTWKFISCSSKEQ